MHRQLIDRCYCAECGAETEIFASGDTDQPDGHVRCCRYCGFELELRQPDSTRRPSAMHYRSEPVHVPLGRG